MNILILGLDFGFLCDSVRVDFDCSV